MNIEDTKPIGVLASRIWSGTHWHYPHIEKMVAELTALRASLAGAVETLTAIAEPDTGGFYVELNGGERQLVTDFDKVRWRMDAAQKALTPPPTKEAT